MLVPSINIVLDACSILNMVNGNVLSIVCSLPYRFLVGPIVYDECTEQPCPEFLKEVQKGTITLLSGNALPVNTFMHLSNQYGLGDGETECIGYAKTFNYCVCTDDRMARSSAESEIPKQSVFGSLRLIKDASQRGILNCQAAFDIYKQMKKLGGFLPNLSSDYFCK